MSQQLKRFVWVGKVTAFQVITDAGATGKMPTSVQFKISNPGDQAVSLSCVTTSILPAMLEMKPLSESPTCLATNSWYSQLFNDNCRSSDRHAFVSIKAAEPHVPMLQLTAAVNGDGSSTAVAARGDSLSPGASPSGSPASASSSNGGCTDNPPSSAYTCEQQVSLWRTHASQGLCLTDWPTHTACLHAGRHSAKLVCLFHVCCVSALWDTGV